MVRDAADLGQLLDGFARYGERTAVADPNGSLSFAALEEGARRWAAAFAAAGVGLGAKVGLLAGNGAMWLAVAFGVWRAGATLVPISTFVTGRELEQTMEHADLDALVLQPRLRSHEFLPMLRQCNHPDSLQQVVVLDT